MHTISIINYPVHADKPLAWISSNISCLAIGLSNLNQVYDLIVFLTDTHQTASPSSLNLPLCQIFTRILWMRNLVRMHHRIPTASNRSIQEINDVRKCSIPILSLENWFHSRRPAFRSMTAQHSNCDSGIHWSLFSAAAEHKMFPATFEWWNRSSPPEIKQYDSPAKTSDFYWLGLITETPYSLYRCWTWISNPPVADESPLGDGGTTVSTHNKLVIRYNSHRA